MATLNLDLSEYDSLRESLKEKDFLISKYEKIIQDLENKSRVIIKTKHIKPNIDSEYLVAKIYSELNTAPCSSYSPSWPLRNAVHKALLNYKDWGNFQNDSTQYIGFDDVEETVRAEFRNKINKELEELERAQKTHKKLIEKTEAECKEQYEKYINDLEEENKKLKEEIAELRKSKEEKIAELIATIKKSEKQLEELGSKEGFFTRLYKKLF